MKDTDDRIEDLEEKVEILRDVVQNVQEDLDQLAENVESGLGHAEANAIKQTKQEIAEEYSLDERVDGEELVEQAFIRGFKASWEGLNGEVFQGNLDKYEGDFEQKLRQYFAEEIAEMKQKLLQTDGEGDDGDN